MGLCLKESIGCPANFHMSSQGFPHGLGKRFGVLSRAGGLGFLGSSFLFLAKGAQGVHRFWI